MSEQAYIQIYDEQDKAGEKIMVQYNPAEYSLDASARYSEKQDAAKAQPGEFIGEGPETLTFKLTIDGMTKAGTTDAGKAANIISDVKALKRLAVIDPKLHKPPSCAFFWGAMKFKGVVERLNIRYSMFSAEGKPIRATVDLTMRGIESEKKPYESPDRTKRRVLIQDTELFLLADELYQDPAQWRPIAQANGIKNPRRIATGATLRIPPLEEPAS